MRHSYYGRQLGRTTNERQQLFRNLIKAVIFRGEIITTLAKAKAIQPELEKLISIAKAETLTSYRQLTRICGDQKTAQQLKNLGQVFGRRPGGYTRIIKLGPRQGDNAPLVKLELVEKLIAAEVVKTPKPSKTQSKNTKKMKSLPKAKSKATDKTKK